MDISHRIRQSSRDGILQENYRVCQVKLEKNLTVISDRKHSMRVRNVTCTRSLGHDICVFTFRMNFELRGWHSQPPTFSSNSSKVTKNAQLRTSILTCWRLCWLASKFKIHSKGKNTNVRTYGTCTCHVSDPHGVFSVWNNRLVSSNLTWDTL